MAALALVGTMMTGCTSDDIATEKPQQNNNSTVTLTTTIVLDGSDTTRALDADGFRRQVHCGAGNVEFHDSVFHAELAEIFSYFIDCHMLPPYIAHSNTFMFVRKEKD